MPQRGLGSMQGSSSTKSLLPPKLVFHQRSYSTKGHLPLKVVFHQRLSSTEGHFLPKVVFHWRSSSTEGCLPSKVISHQRLSSTEGSLPLMVVFHRRLSSTKGCLPPKVVFLQMSSSINQNTLVGTRTQPGRPTIWKRHNPEETIRSWLVYDLFTTCSCQDSLDLFITCKSIIHHLFMKSQTWLSISYGLPIIARTCS